MPLNPDPRKKAGELRLAVSNRVSGALRTSSALALLSSAQTFLDGWSVKNARRIRLV